MITKGDECTKAKINSDAGLLKFAESYNKWKASGYYPVEIRDIIMEVLDCGPSTYYKYLRIARNKQFITDTYEETAAKSIEARRAWMIANGGIIKGVKFFFPKRIVKGTCIENAENTSTFKNIIKSAKRLFAK